MRPFFAPWQPPDVDGASANARTSAGALLGAWRGGDGRAGQRLVVLLGPEIRRYFARRVPEHAEELTQRTLEGLVRGRDVVHTNGEVRRYLFGIAYKTLLKHYAERRRQHDPLEPDALTSTATLDVSLDQAQIRHALADAMAQLPPDLRDTVERHYWDGMSTAELARADATRPGTIKSRLFRARKLLRGWLLDLAPQDELRAPV